MTGWIVIGIVLSLLVIIGLIRAGVKACYSEAGLEIWAKIAFFKKKVYPPKKNEKLEKAEDKKKEKRKTEEGEKKEKGGPLEQFKKYYGLAVDMLKKLVGAVRIDLLRVRFTAASKDDPAKAAIMYGEAWAAEGIIISILENNIRIRKKEIEILVDYNAEKPSVYCLAELSANIGGLLWAGIRIAANYVKKAITQNLKGGAKNGKANC